MSCHICITIVKIFSPVLLSKKQSLIDVFTTQGGLPFARGAAMVLNFNCMLVLLSMCRNIISLIRSNLGVCILICIPYKRSIEWSLFKYFCQITGNACHYQREA